MGFRFFIGCLVAVFFISCNDGYLGVSAIDFSKTDVSSCVTDTSATVFFKIKGKEVLILQIPKDKLRNQLTVIPIEIPIPGKAKLIYRVFSENVNSAYFCDPLPSVKHVVIDSQASRGTLIIETRADIDDRGEVVSYTHTFRILNLLLSSVKKSEGSVASDELLYGTFSTQVNN